jgi:transposase InsO family protein
MNALPNCGPAWTCITAKLSHIAGKASDLRTGPNTLEASVHDYVHHYNHERIKLRLQGLSPVVYRLRSTSRSAES